MLQEVQVLMGLRVIQEPLDPLALSVTQDLQGHLATREALVLLATQVRLEELALRVTVVLLEELALSGILALLGLRGILGLLETQEAQVQLGTLALQAL